MSQVTSGVRAILANPFVYDTLQNIMGAQRIRQDLVDNFIRPTSGSRILDIGCGTAEILRYLPATNIGYWGYDISQEYINTAIRRFNGRGHFYCKMLERGDLVHLPKFNVILLMGVLHHLDDMVAKNLFGLVRDILTDGGRLITIDPCLAEKQNPIARYLILHDRGQNVRDAEGYRHIAGHAFPLIKGTLRHRRWIPYTHWIMECSI